MPFGIMRGARRRALLAGGLGAAGAALAACGQIGVGGTEGVAAKPVGKPQGTVESLTVWDRTREPLMNEQIKDFQQLFPAINIRHSLVPAAQMYDKYTAAIASGTSPDSIMVHGRMMPAMADKGQLQVLDPYVRRDAIKPTETWYEPEWQGQLWQGKAYGLPLASGGGNFVLYYNRSHFQEGGLNPQNPPKTWQDLATAADRLTQRGGGRLGFASNGLLTAPTPAPSPPTSPTVAGDTPSRKGRRTWKPRGSGRSTPAPAKGISSSSSRKVAPRR